MPRRSILTFVTTLMTVAMLFDAASAGFSEFTAICPVSHWNFDDPIVFPSQPGASHEHQYYGSDIVDAYTLTVTDMLAGSTTCAPTTDKSGYWHPSLRVAATGVAVPVQEAKFYYHTFHADNANTIPFPLNFRIIAGNAQATTSSQNPNMQWGCTGGGAGVSGPTIPQNNCARLEFLLNFPECWNGVDLDSPNHKSHMAYKVGQLCPSTHPNLMPRLQFKIQFDTSATGTTGLVLSSDPVGTTTPGLTLHGDFINAWDPNALASRVLRCSHINAKCNPTQPTNTAGPYSPFVPVVNATGAVTWTINSLTGEMTQV